MTGVLRLILILSFSGPMSGASAQEPKAVEPKTVVLRLSRGSFAPADYDTVKARLDASQKALATGLKKLPGLRRFWAGIDRASSTMINMSVWDSLANAQQLDTFTPMLDLAKEFIALGVKFERPVVNYQVLWDL